MKFEFIQHSEFDRVLAHDLPKDDQLRLICRMARYNTLVNVKKAGSGHLGTSFSSMEIFALLYFEHLNVRKLGVNHPDRDIFFSSKGHDVPGLYSVLYGIGILPEERFVRLRRLGGLHGHPDIGLPGIEANSGSLGMGISKARGFAYAKKHQNRGGRVYVMTGDGELQEGQNFEALQSTVQQGLTNVTVLVDHNKLQSDRLVDQIVGLRNLETKFASFGWNVSRVDGHDIGALRNALKKAEAILDQPKIIICDTIKGRGVSFMEHPRALKDGNGFYRWHAGAPDDEAYSRAHSELLSGIEAEFNHLGLAELRRFTAPEEPTKGVPSFVSKTGAEFIAEAYGKRLVELAETVKEFVVLDADLSADCKLREFEDRFSSRFIEMGIAEQDMVSMASGIALSGLVPVVNSFANFLAARANEQIYNALTEKKKIVFACHYAGLIPAGPGKSHQSTRDISLFAAFPNCAILQAANSEEMRMIVDYVLCASKESCMLRINIGPSPRPLTLPGGYELRFGQGVALTPGQEVVLFAYGPVMLHEALLAHEELAKRGLTLKVINFPWLNRFDRKWLQETLGGATHVFALEDHSPVAGFGDRLLDILHETGITHAVEFEKFGVEGYPECGTPSEVLRHHRLDGISLAERILGSYRKTSHA